jgi:hypothetical protein
MSIAMSHTYRQVLFAKIFSVHEGEGGPANSQAAQTQGPVQIDGCFVLNKGLLRGAVATQSAFVIRT